MRPIALAAVLTTSVLKPHNPIRPMTPGKAPCLPQDSPGRVRMHPSPRHSGKCEKLHPWCPSGNACARAGRPRSGSNRRGGGGERKTGGEDGVRRSEREKRGRRSTSGSPERAEDFPRGGPCSTRVPRCESFRRLNWHRFGRSRAELVRLRPKFGRCRAKFDRSRAEFGRSRAKFGRCRSESGRSWPKSCRTRHWL